ncbi:MAG TPA: hypothetical protein VKZ70_07070, partial [Burkholderiaceae bacterium]|nr:hypothetical protein [Burkholderiaceae bacterium]
KPFLFFEECIIDLGGRRLRVCKRGHAGSPVVFQYSMSKSCGRSLLAIQAALTANRPVGQG